MKQFALIAAVLVCTLAPAKAEAFHPIKTAVKVFSSTVKKAESVASVTEKKTVKAIKYVGSHAGQIAKEAGHAVAVSLVEGVAMTILVGPFTVFEVMLLSLVK